jgi:hypothetical protein
MAFFSTVMFGFGTQISPILSAFIRVHLRSSAVRVDPRPNQLARNPRTDP